MLTWEGGGYKSQNKRQAVRVGRPRAREPLPLPAHFPAFECPQTSAQSWQLSVIIPATPRAPAPGSASRAGERHLPGSDEMPVSVPAAASRPRGLQGGPASLAPSLHQFFNTQPGFLLSPRGGGMGAGSVTTWHLSQRGSSFKKHLVTLSQKFLKALRVWRFCGGHGG